jgi:acyl carrier protein
MGSLEPEETIRRIVARLARRLDGGAAAPGAIAPVEVDPASLDRDADVFRELGIASSAALELLLSMEEELGIQIEDAAFNDARTIAALADLAARARR